MLPCDVDALIHPDEPLPEEHRLVEAAACDLPLQPEELERWLAPRAPDDGPDAGELIVVSTVPIWVAVDGRYLHASDEGRWRAGRPIGPGRCSIPYRSVISRWIPGVGSCGRPIDCLAY